MSSKKNIPAIRFSGFNGEWENDILDRLSDVRDGTHESPKYHQNGYRFVTSKNIKEGKISFDDIQYISEEDYLNINKRSNVDSNDILMGMIGTIGNIAIVGKDADFAIKNVALIKHTNKINYLYLYAALQSNNILSQLNDGMDGGTQKFIALNRVRSLIIPSPIDAEQQQIGNYFQNIDKLINQSSSRLEKLKSLKKAYLEKMFPKHNSTTPEIRFKGFSGEWKRTYLKDLGIWNRGRMLPKSDLDINGIYPCIHYGELFSYTEIINFVNSRTSVQNESISSGNDLLFPDSDVTPDGLGRCSSLQQEGVILGGGMELPT